MVYIEQGNVGSITHSARTMVSDVEGYMLRILVKHILAHPFSHDRCSEFDFHGSVGWSNMLQIIFLSSFG